MREVEGNEGRRVMALTAPIEKECDWLEEKKPGKGRESSHTRDVT